MVLSWSEDKYSFSSQNTPEFIPVDPKQGNRLSLPRIFGLTSHGRGARWTTLRLALFTGGAVLHPLRRVEEASPSCLGPRSLKGYTGLDSSMSIVRKKNTGDFTC